MNPEVFDGKAWSFKVESDASNGTRVVLTIVPLDTRMEMPTEAFNAFVADAVAALQVAQVTSGTPSSSS